jgi:RNA polymerase sigma-70 factor (ECF subfamily)
MQESRGTPASVSERLRNGSHPGAWTEFVRLYASVIFGFARKRGLTDTESAELMQQVLRSVLSAEARLDNEPGSGAFRDWLFSITRDKIRGFIETRSRSKPELGDSGMHGCIERHADTDGAQSGEWEAAYRSALTARAMEQVRREFQPRTWRAYYMAVVEGRSPAQVASRIGLSVGAVCVAKSRVIARLRHEIERIQRNEF